MLGVVDVLIAGLEANNPTKCAPIVAQLPGALADLQTHMLQHLHEEEVVGLPLLRHNFTAKDMKTPEEKILKHLTPADMVRGCFCVHTAAAWRHCVAPPDWFIHAPSPHSRARL